MHGDVRSVTLAGVESMAIASQAVVYTDSFKLKQGMYFGLWMLAAGTTPDLKIELEESYTTPATENAADTTKYAVPIGMSAIVSSLTVKVAQVTFVNPVPMTYGRFKITGNAANTADVTLKMKLFLQDTIL